MMRSDVGRRVRRRLIDLAVWCAIFGTGCTVGTWWSHAGPELLGRLAALSERPSDPDRAPVPAAMGPRKRAYFDRAKAAGAGYHLPSGQASALDQGFTAR